MTENKYSKFDYMNKVVDSQIFERNEYENQQNAMTVEQINLLTRQLNSCQYRHINQNKLIIEKLTFPQQEKLFISQIPLRIYLPRNIVLEQHKVTSAKDYQIQNKQKRTQQILQELENLTRANRIRQEAKKFFDKERRDSIRATEQLQFILSNQYRTQPSGVPNLDITPRAPEIYQEPENRPENYEDMPELMNEDEDMPELMNEDENPIEIMAEIPNENDQLPIIINQNDNPIEQMAENDPPIDLNFEEENPQIPIENPEIPQDEQPLGPFGPNPEGGGGPGGPGGPGGNPGGNAGNPGGNGGNPNDAFEIDEDELNPEEPVEFIGKSNFFIPKEDLYQKEMMAGSRGQIQAGSTFDRHSATIRTATSGLKEIRLNQKIEPNVTFSFYGLTAGFCSKVFNRTFENENVEDLAIYQLMLSSMRLTVEQANTRLDNEPAHILDSFENEEGIIIQSYKRHKQTLNQQGVSNDIPVNLNTSDITAQNQLHMMINQIKDFIQKQTKKNNLRRLGILDIKCMQMLHRSPFLVQVINALAKIFGNTSCIVTFRSCSTFTFETRHMATRLINTAMFDVIQPKACFLLFNMFRTDANFFNDQDIDRLKLDKNVDSYYKSGLSNSSFVVLTPKATRNGTQTLIEVTIELQPVKQLNADLPKIGYYIQKKLNKLELALRLQSKLTVWIDQLPQNDTISPELAQERQLLSIEALYGSSCLSSLSDLTGYRQNLEQEENGQTTQLSTLVFKPEQDVMLRENKMRSVKIIANNKQRNSEITQAEIHRSGKFQHIKFRQMQWKTEHINSKSVVWSQEPSNRYQGLTHNDNGLAQNNQNLIPKVRVLNEKCLHPQLQACTHEATVKIYNTLDPTKDQISVTNASDFERKCAQLLEIPIQFNQHAWEDGFRDTNNSIKAKLTTRYGFEQSKPSKVIDIHCSYQKEKLKFGDSGVILAMDGHCKHIFKEGKERDGSQDQNKIDQQTVNPALPENRDDQTNQIEYKVIHSPGHWTQEAVGNEVHQNHAPAFIQKSSDNNSASVIINGNEQQAQIHQRKQCLWSVEKDGQQNSFSMISQTILSEEEEYDEQQNVLGIGQEYVSPKQYQHNDKSKTLSEDKNLSFLTKQILKMTLESAEKGDVEMTQIMKHEASRTTQAINLLDKDQIECKDFWKGFFLDMFKNKLAISKTAKMNMEKNLKTEIHHVAYQKGLQQAQFVKSMIENPMYVNSDVEKPGNMEIFLRLLSGFFSTRKDKQKPEHQMEKIKVIRQNEKVRGYVNKHEGIMRRGQVPQPVFGSDQMVQPKNDEFQIPVIEEKPQSAFIIQNDAKKNQTPITNGNKIQPVEITPQLLICNPSIKHIQQLNSKKFILTRPLISKTYLENTKPKGSYSDQLPKPWKPVQSYQTSQASVFQALRNRLCQRIVGVDPLFASALQTESFKQAELIKPYLQESIRSLSPVEIFKGIKRSKVEEQKKSVANMDEYQEKRRDLEQDFNVKQKQKSKISKQAQQQDVVIKPNEQWYMKSLPRQICISELMGPEVQINRYLVNAIKDQSREETVLKKVPIIGYNTADLVTKLNNIMEQVRMLSEKAGLSIKLHIVFLDGSGFDGSLHQRIKAIAHIYADACKAFQPFLPDWNIWVDRYFGSVRLLRIKDLEEWKKSILLVLQGLTTTGDAIGTTFMNTMTCLDVQAALLIQFIELISICATGDDTFIICSESISTPIKNIIHNNTSRHGGCASNISQIVKELGSSDNEFPFCSKLIRFDENGIISLRRPLERILSQIGVRKEADKGEKWERERAQCIAQELNVLNNQLTDLCLAKPVIQKLFEIHRARGKIANLISEKEQLKLSETVDPGNVQKFTSYSREFSEDISEQYDIEFTALPEEMHLQINEIINWKI